MAKRTFQVFISPVHAIQISADSLEVIQNVLQFKKDEAVCGQFSQYLGWVEILEDKKEPGSVVSLVRTEPLSTSPPPSTGPADSSIFVQPGQVNPANEVREVAQLCVQQITKGCKILICGNGGSAAQASHFAAELVVRYAKTRRALPCIALTVDQAVITACANDLGYHTIFERQVEALGRPGDVLLCISTSGKSENVNLAYSRAALSGMFPVDVPRLGEDTGARQQYQLQWLHFLAAMIEDAFS